MNLDYEGSGGGAYEDCSVERDEGLLCPLGDQFLMVYSNLNASVKDVKEKEGKVTVVTAKMLTVNKGKSRLGASVSIKFNQEFASNVSWQRVDERTGAEIPDEDIIDGGGDVPSPSDGDGEEMEP